MYRKQGGPSDKGMVRSSIRMLIPLDRQSEAIDILNSVTAGFRFDPGCISSRVYRDVDDVRAILVEELWANQEEITRHLRSEAYHRLLLVIEMAEEPPEVRFETIAATRGLETIAQARQVWDTKDA